MLNRSLNCSTLWANYLDRANGNGPSPESLNTATTIERLPFGSRFAS